MSQGIKSLRPEFLGFATTTCGASAVQALGAEGPEATQRIRHGHSVPNKKLKKEAAPAAPRQVKSAVHSYQK